MPWWPVRAFCPLCPLPDVLPLPEPGPRPSRLRSRCAPSGRGRLFRSAMSTLPSGDFFDPDEVPHLEEHAADRRTVGLLDGLLVVAQPERAQRGAVHGRPPDAAAHLRDAQYA